MKFFFDSHGMPHVTCSGDHPEAAAFGPTGISRRATLADVELLRKQLNIRNLKWIEDIRDLRSLILDSQYALLGDLEVVGIEEYP